MVSISSDRFNGVVAGLAYKAPCVAVATSNITLSGEQTVGGTAVVTDDRVLVVGQTNQIENGIYDVASSAWTRAPDFDGNRDVTGGTKVAIARPVGSLIQANVYEVAGVGEFRPGTDAITFRLVSGQPYYPLSPTESANGLTDTDIIESTYEWGNVLRYGAVDDSDTDTQGTDNTAAFNKAVSSGHRVWVPSGYYSIEGTIELFGNPAQGGVHLELSGFARLERYTNNSDPLLHVAGQGHTVNGNNCTIAARNFGGFDKGLVLLGADPAITVNTDDSCVDTINNTIHDIKILGKTGTTTWDGSIGFYCEAARRKQGQFITPNTINCYYNNISGIYSVQWDYGFFLSTDSNANTFTACHVNTFGHAAWHINGYANQIVGYQIEKGVAQDTTERYAFNFGNKDSGPEDTYVMTDYDSTKYTITGITKGTTTKFDVSTDPTTTVSTTDKVRILGIVDNGGGSSDLEAALNGGHFEVTAVDATSITVSADTNGLTATWQSGGTVYDSIYPIIGAQRNYCSGFAELSFVPSTTVVRLIGCSEPLANYDTGNSNAVWGYNVIHSTGVPVGGIGPNGFSTEASVLSNIVESSTTGWADYRRRFRAGNFEVGALDDASGAGYGSKYHRTFTGRMANMNQVTQPTTYTVLTVDNVGITAAGVLIKLSYVFKESAGQDTEAGTLAWLCPVAGGTGVSAVALTDDIGNANFRAKHNFATYICTWSITAGAGTKSDTGKFELKVTMADVTGTDNGFLVWVAEILHTNLDDSNLDWAADVTIQNGGLSDTGGAE